MTALSKWSTTADNNNDASPDGFPEGMAPSGVNNSAREVMAAVRTWYEDAEWPIYGVNGHANGYSISYVSATLFKFASTDRRTIAPVTRRVKAGVGAGIIYGTVTDVTLSASDTQVTVRWDSGQLDNSLSYVALGVISPTNSSLNGQSLVLIQEQDASNSTSVDFTAGINSTYKNFQLEIADLIPATDGASPNLLVSEDGSNWQSDAADYGWTTHRAIDNGTGADTADNSDSAIELTAGAGVGSASGEGAEFTVQVRSPSGGLNKIIRWDGSFITNGGVLQRVSGAGRYISNNAITGVRIVMSSGNITSGNFKLYGVR